MAPELRPAPKRGCRCRRRRAPDGRGHPSSSRNGIERCGCDDGSGPEPTIGWVASSPRPVPARPPTGPRYRVACNSVTPRWSVFRSGSTPRRNRPAQMRCSQCRRRHTAPIYGTAGADGLGPARVAARRGNYPVVYRHGPPAVRRTPGARHPGGQGLATLTRTDAGRIIAAREEERRLPGHPSPMSAG